MSITFDSNEVRGVPCGTPSVLHRTGSGFAPYRDALLGAPTKVPSLANTEPAEKKQKGMEQRRQIDVDCLVIDFSLECEHNPLLLFSIRPQLGTRVPAIFLFDYLQYQVLLHLYAVKLL